jgi:GNAT superfamily N-acetyltransferase
MEMHIRKAETWDVPAFAEIIRDLGWFAHVNAETPEETQARISRHLALCLADKSHSLHVALDPHGEIVGYVSVHWLPYLILAGPEGYVSELFVKDIARGKGIGTKLLEAVIAEARDRGCARLMLLNGRHRDAYEREFYKKCGWTERPEMANFVYYL